MRALDLFCGAGGAGRGLSLADFDVVGVDIALQPNYPFEFVRADALGVLDHMIAGHCHYKFDFVWASPPCQAFTAYKRRKNHVAPRENLIPEVRKKLKRLAIPYVIENVPGAPLEEPFILCGSSFGLDVRRHRIFEASFPVEPPPCRHEDQAPRFPQATNRKNLRRTVEVGVWRIPLATQQKAMGITWMTREELSEAVPPAYACFIAMSFFAMERECRELRSQ